MGYLHKMIDEALADDDFGGLIEELAKFVWKAISHDTDGIPTVGGLLDYEEDDRFSDILRMSDYVICNYDEILHSIEYQLDREL